MQLAITREIIVRLEAAQEKRSLSQAEQELRKELKMKTLRLASLACTIARQRSRVQFLAEGDANTKFFQLQACHRNRKNFIQSLQEDNLLLTAEEEKWDLADNYYKSILGGHHPRPGRLHRPFLQDGLVGYQA